LSVAAEAEMLQVKYRIGDKVRMAMQRQPFRKGYLGDWSEKIFEIA